PLMLSRPSCLLFLLISLSLRLLSSFSFSFLLRHPPSPPLFPYTTLFRSALRAAHLSVTSPSRLRRATSPQGEAFRGGGPYDLYEIEEHTSELQSRFDLVCRLLLEKKKVRRQE